MKLKDLEDFSFFRLHPSGRLLVKSGITGEQGHKCYVFCKDKISIVLAKTGAKVPVPTTGEVVYYPPGQTIYLM